MAHELTTRTDGTVEAAYAIQPAWHQLGAVIDHAMTAKEVIAESHTDWQVSPREIFVGNADGAFTKADGYQANVRDDSSALLSITTDGYEIVQNNEFLKWFDRIVDEGGFSYESAGSLRGGKIVWYLARNGQYSIGSDAHRRYVLGVNYHTGRDSGLIMPTDVRVVCANTLALATTGQHASYKFRHIGDVSGQLEQIRQAIGLMESRSGKLRNLYGALEIVPLSAETYLNYIDTLYPEPPQPDIARQSYAMTIKKRLAFIWEDGTGTTSSKNAYTAFHSVSQYLNHDRRVIGRTEANRVANRFESALLGKTGGDIRTALRVAVDTFSPAENRLYQEIFG